MRREVKLEQYARQVALEEYLEQVRYQAQRISLSYRRLVVSEHSSGERTRRGGKPRPATDTFGGRAACRLASNRH